MPLVPKRRERRSAEACTIDKKIAMKNLKMRLGTATVNARIVLVRPPLPGQESNIIAVGIRKATRGFVYDKIRQSVTSWYEPPIIIIRMVNH